MELITELKEYNILPLMEKANKITLKEHGSNISLERAIFLSWWCAKGDCAFCYMSTQKKRIDKPKNAQRHIFAIYAEAELCRRTGWNIEFLSGGYEAYTQEEIRDISKNIYNITGSPVWLNTGITNDLDIFGEEIEGITGAVEMANPKKQKEVCPSKPLEDICEMLDTAHSLGFKKAITIILGLGETPEDLEHLFKLIEDLKIDRIIFYSLNAHDNTPFAGQPQPASMYYSGVVSTVRIMFPKIEIICGTWTDNLANIGPLILSGANGLTKFPLFNIYGTSKGKRVEEEVKWTGRTLTGTFTDFDRLMTGTASEKVEPYVQRYIDKCLGNKPKK